MVAELAGIQFGEFVDAEGDQAGGVAAGAQGQLGIAAGVVQLDLGVVRLAEMCIRDRVGLLNDRARLVGIAMRAIAGTQTVVFANLKPGTYAVIAFHDANDNGKLDENWLGEPTEGYAFSNNAEGFLSAPSFKNAGILLGNHDLSVVITLKYPPVSYTHLYGVAADIGWAGVGSQAGRAAGAD